MENTTYPELLIVTNLPDQGTIAARHHLQAILDQINPIG